MSLIFQCWHEKNIGKVVDLGKGGFEGRDRTADIQINNLALFLLSYLEMVAPIGFEPMTSWL